MGPMNGVKTLVPRGLGEGAPAAVFVPSLRERATTFHRDTYGVGCECLDDETYPCEDCADEISELMELLDGVARDAIDQVCRAWERVR